nr:MAG TPA: hypothetical protein [Caudoviricetes sp.]DAX29184.1 MAG TPA: hypothetical protein [Caudoviricetes sp.]DAY22021.1 MAG TPA: hypothetical protein [Caudoviricetes sp.]
MYCESLAESYFFLHSFSKAGKPDAPFLRSVV